MNWHLSSPGLEYNRDEGISVYFHLASGDTHLISGLASELLRTLSSAPHSEESLALKVAENDPRLADLSADERLAAVHELLEQLHTIHLVEPA